MASFILRVLPVYAIKCCRHLTQANIPDSVTYVGEDIFGNCGDGLIETQGVVDYVGKWAVSCYKSVTEADLRSDTLGIVKTTFDRCTSLTTVKFPASLKHIVDYAFNYYSKITDITLSEGLIEIGGGAFYCCFALTENSIPDGAQGIYDYTFDKCTQLKNVDIGNGVERTDFNAFVYCAIESLTTGYSVKTIGRYAFMTVLF